MAELEDEDFDPTADESGDIGQIAKSDQNYPKASSIDSYQQGQNRLEALRLATTCRSGKRTAKQLVKDAIKLEAFLSGNNY